MNSIFNHKWHGFIKGEWCIKILNKDEIVDHIDKNPFNNDLSNLRVLNRRKHTYTYVKENKDIVVTCQCCGKELITSESKLKK